MDVKLCGDIFRLPFRSESVDGIWNVGVMEHFLHQQIDEILTGFNGALRPGGRVVLLWPATDSIPQKLLRAIEAMVNFRQDGARFRFHPDEISKLRSNGEAVDVLTRNGFRVVQVDRGLRSLMAFKILVGEKVQPST
jgi:SAM-dependent methyltransferase